MRKHSGEGGSHYKEHGTTETCVKMEKRAIDIIRCSGFQVPDSIVKSALWYAMEIKHLDRAGKKEGNSIAMEMHKAKNYNTRATTGKWINE